MLKEKAEWFMKLGQEIYDLGVVYGWDDEYGKRDDISGDFVLNEKGASAITRGLKKLLILAERLDLSASKKIIENRLKYSNTLPKTLGEWEIISELLTHEISNRLFLSVPSHLSSYYEWDGIVGDPAIVAFPRASEEIRAAGTCLATGQNTACVFHAMRAAEMGVRVLGETLNISLPVPVAEAEWQAILNAITPKIRDIENSPKSTPNRDADLHFYSEAAAQFRFFKNGWRIRVAHGRATYTEPQAREALDHVRSFFDLIAVRLRE